MAKKKAKEKIILDQHKRVAALMLENGGSVSKAMRDAGYSEAYSKNPQKMKKTKAWNDLMEEYFPDNELAKVHRGLLTANRVDHMVFSPSVSNDQITEQLESVGATIRKIETIMAQKHVWFWTQDTQARKSALDMAYKMKGRYPKEAGIENLNVFAKMTDEELNDVLTRSRNELAKK